jgi:hypothetical protein
VEFQPELLERVVSGTISVTFRRLPPGRVRPGQRFETPLGFVVLGVIKAIDAETLRDADARRAGYASREALLTELSDSGEGTIFRIELRHEATAV